MSQNHHDRKTSRFLDPRLWFAGLALMLAPGAVSAYSPANADTIMNSYNNAFYVGNNGNGYFKNDQNGGTTYFWGQAEEIEAVEDANDRTGTYGSMITSLLNGFGVNNGTNWSWNIYNDDIMWACIAYLRGYQATGNVNFRNIAKSNFDMMFARGWDSVLGGGLYWTTDKHEKNACINGPAAIASYLLYQTLGDSSYLTKAQDILAWEKSKLFNTSTGAIYDNININGQVGTWASAYNQGTFVGAAHFLGDVDSATLAANCTMNTMGTKNAAGFTIMPEYGANGNNSGFNAIGLRWISRFMRDRCLESTYLPWMEANADAAWNVRRTSDNLSWCQWLHATPSTTLMSWDCVSSVVALQVARPSTAVAIFYKDCNFGGSAQSLPVGDFTMASMKAHFINDDDISSVRVKNGYKAILCWDDNFSGATLQTTGENSCLVDEGWNDKATSLRVRPNGITGLNGTYLLQNRNSGLTMDVASGNPANGTQILQWNNTGAANQQFTFTDLGDGLYKIINVQTNKTIDVSGISTDNFANVTIWDYVGGRNQQFIVQATDSGYYKLIASHSSKLLEVGYASTAINATVNQYDDNGQTCGQWKLVPVSTPWSVKIEAESYANMAGIATETCSEGGQNVGWIDAGDWMVWNVTLPAAGTYTVQYRVSSPNTGGVIKFEMAGGSVTYGTVNVPNTGGWQNWQTISHTVSLPAGAQQLAIAVPVGGYNLNWLQISK